MRCVAVLASVLAMSVVMLAPSTASADHDLTCHPPTDPDLLDEVAFAYDTIDFNAGVVLGFSIDTQGAVKPRGWVRLDGALLRPQAAGSSAQCADTNGNGIAGLTQAQIALEDGRTGAQWFAVILPQLEMDARGRYAGTVEICGAGACTRHEVEIRALVTRFR